MLGNKKHINERIKTSALYRAYTEWSTKEWQAGQGMATLSRREFITAMQEKGFIKGVHDGYDIWKGINLIKNTNIYEDFTNPFTQK